jgi:hypothetical protein
MPGTCRDSILKGVAKQALPKVEKKSTTEPQPFNLATDRRGSAKRPAPEDDQGAAGTAKRDSQVGCFAIRLNSNYRQQQQQQQQQPGCAMITAKHVLA